MYGLNSKIPRSTRWRGRQHPSHHRCEHRFQVGGESRHFVTAFAGQVVDAGDENVHRDGGLFIPKLLKFSLRSPPRSLRCSAFRFRSLVLPDLTNEPDQTRFEAMKILNVQEAKTHLSRLMEDAAAGEEILLAKHGKPMVRLSAYRPESEPRKLGGYEKEIRVAEDFDDEDPRVLALFHAS